MKNTYILNTIAFQSRFQAGERQEDVVGVVKELGFDAIEVRNELLTGGDEEITRIANLAQEAGLDVYYSVNDVLVDSEHLTSNLSRYIHEMRLLGSNHLKMNIGKLTKVTSQTLQDELVPLMDGSFELNLENNQTLADSSLDTTRAFYQLASQVELPDVHYCFDIANWSWLDASADQAAVALNPVTTYLHLKNETTVAGKLTVTPLEEGDLDWRKLLASFDNVNAYGFEYAGNEATIKQELVLLKEYLEDFGG